MKTTLKNAQQLASIAAKEERARDAALAMQEYQAEKLAIGVKTERLRALRLAKEAEASERTKRKNPGTRTAGIARDRCPPAPRPEVQSHFQPQPRLVSPVLSPARISVSSSLLERLR